MKLRMNRVRVGRGFRGQGFVMWVANRHRGIRLGASHKVVAGLTGRLETAALALAGISV